MKFSTILAFLPLAVSAIPSLDIRATDNSKAVEAGLANLEKDVTAINNTINTIPPNAQTIDFGTLITLLTESNQVVTDLNSTAAAANSSAPFNGPDAVQIGISNIQLSNNVKSLLNNFQYRVKAFRNQGVATIVAQQLVTQREFTREFANGLAPKLGAIAPFAPFISNDLLAKFDQTIKIYNATS